MKKIVISGINIFQAGALSIYKALLTSIVEEGYDKKYSITILVSKKELFEQFSDKFEVIEFPKSRKNYLYRLFYEYIYFYFFSRKRNIDIWFSLHDVTPNVIAKEKYVYCHNPLPFMSKEIAKYLKMGIKTKVVKSLYKYVYRINIKKNKAVIVQQEWLRDNFEEMFKIKNVLVARPESPKTNNAISVSNDENKEKYEFIFPSYPRSFKNFDIICKADEILESKGVSCNILLTVDQNSQLFEKYKHLSNISWVGLLTQDELWKAYQRSDCLIFPSLLETWGLPISEYRQFGKPILCSDLPYAHETIGEYELVKFFDPIDAENLAKIMEYQINNNLHYDNNIYTQREELSFSSWRELLGCLFK